MGFGASFFIGVFSVDFFIGHFLLGFCYWHWAGPRDPSELIGRDLKKGTAAHDK